MQLSSRRTAPISEIGELDRIRGGYILFVTGTYLAPSERGSTGGTISNYYLMRQIAKNRTVVVLHLASDEDDATLKDETIDIVRKGWPRWRGLKLIANWIPFVKSQTNALIRERGAPCAIIATASTSSSLDARLAHGIPSSIIVRAFENFGFWPPKVTLGTRISYAKQALVRRFSDGRYMRMARVIATNSRFMSGCIEARFGVDMGRVRVLPVFCDVHPIGEGCRNMRNTIGFVNRNVDKNLAFVFELARELQEKQFVVYGTTTSDVGLSPPNVEFRGWESDRSQMFSQAALWIVPSLWGEALGRVSIEAQAANRRVLVSNVGGLPETVSDRDYIMECFDAPAWADRIRELFDLPGNVVAANGALVRERFGIRAHDEAVHDFLADLLGSGTDNRLALHGDD